MKAWLSQSVGAQEFQGSLETRNLKYNLLSPSQHLCHYHILNPLCCYPVQAYEPPTQ